jgi:glycosyltransferase involved in cell wall biosynthesis
MKPYRIIHFVSGAGTGSTLITMSLAFGNRKGVLFEPLLIFRHDQKINEALLKQIDENQVKFFEVSEKPNYQTISQLIKIIKDFKPHIMVAHGFTEHIWGRAAAVIAKVPIIIQVEHSAEKYLLHRYFASRILSHFTNKIICVSERVKNYLVYLGFNRRKMVVIYNGIPVTQFLSVEECPYCKRQNNVVMVARFANPKDHPTLIKAAKLLQDWRVESKTILIGGGSNRYHKKSKDLCNKLNLLDKVFFWGHKETSEIRDILSKSKIFVLSTNYEGFPGVVIEAMTAGCVVVASKVGGIPELIKDGVNGYLVPPRNPKALAGKIKFILEHEEIAAQIAKEGQKHSMKNFTVERMVKEYEELFLNEIKK